MALSDIKKLGDPVLSETASDVTKEELHSLLPEINKMWDLILEFRKKYDRGRAIAAPQVGILKRIICINTDHPLALINPEIVFKSDEMIELWDDCMSFPELFVWLKRHKKITVSFYNLNWERKIWHLEDDMSELIQHEYDHLDGILSISRAENVRCFKWADS